VGIPWIAGLGGHTVAVTRRNLLIGVGVVVAFVLVVGGVLLFRSGDEGTQTTTSVPDTSTSTTTTTRVPNPTAPLTGLEASSPEVAGRCAVTVKIGNMADAHPQYQVSDADVVYEQVVDGGITRLAAVYQSKSPNHVGSVRSVRPTDKYILWPLRGVFTFSGGNHYEMASLNGVPVVWVTENDTDLLFRGPGRAPNNLFAKVDEIYSRCEDPAPAPLFAYRPEGTPAVGTPTTDVVVGFGRGYDTAWTWDAPAGVWQRTIFDAPDLDPDGNRVGTENVVVMQVRYPPDPTGNTVEAAMLGEGPVTVFTGGVRIDGTWRRPVMETAAELIGPDGAPIALTPGRTWVELMPLGNPVTATP